MVGRHSAAPREPSNGPPRAAAWPSPRSRPRRSPRRWRASRCTKAIAVARRAARDPARRRRPAGRGALPGALRASWPRSSPPPRSSSPRSSRSTPARSSRSCPPLAAALTGGIGAVAFANPERSPLQAVLDRLMRGVGGNQRTARLRAGCCSPRRCSSVASALVAAEHQRAAPDGAEHRQPRFDIRGTQPAPPDVVLVSIDDETFSEPPQPRWPFPRRDHAKVIRHLTRPGRR